MCEISIVFEGTYYYYVDCELQGEEKKRVRTYFGGGLAALEANLEERGVDLCGRDDLSVSLDSNTSDELMFGVSFEMSSTDVDIMAKSGCATTYGNRSHMEDFNVVADSMRDDCAECALYAVFDGHAGQNAARFASRSIVDSVTSQDCFHDDICGALRQSFLQIDANFLRLAEDQVLIFWDYISGENVASEG